MPTAEDLFPEAPDTSHAEREARDDREAHERAVDAAQPRCLHEDTTIEGIQCTRPIGHDGPHYRPLRRAHEELRAPAGSFDDDAVWGMLPDHLREGLQNYVYEHRSTGGFLTAVLENDLLGAITRADSISLDALPEIVRFVWNFVAPGYCHGSRKAVEDWIGGRR